jgi:hypothetical protein
VSGTYSNSEEWPSLKLNAGASGGILNTVDGGHGLAKIFNFVGDLKQQSYSSADFLNGGQV